MENSVFISLFFELIKGLVLFFGFTSAALLFITGIYILKNRHAWESNREAVKMFNGGMPLFDLPFDYHMRVNPGLAVHKKTNRWISVGTLTRSAIEDIFT